MNRRDAREIAEKISNEQLLEMFKAAKKGIKDWSARSNVNSSMSMGTAWNVLAANFKIEDKHHILGKTNMIREFGEFLPKELSPAKRTRRKKGPVTMHQEPSFENY